MSTQSNSKPHSLDEITKKVGFDSPSAMFDAAEAKQKNFKRNLSVDEMRKFNTFNEDFVNIANMPTKERTILLCQLSVKEQFNTIEPHEIVQLAIIQSIRHANGEIDAVLKSWEENLDLDPRH